jgi:hypothetical protein
MNKVCANSMPACRSAFRHAGMWPLEINYIHMNPVSGKWNLVEDYTDYPYSSAAYYELGKENKYITHYKELNSASFRLL